MENMHDVISQPKKDLLSRLLTGVNGFASFWIFLLMCVITLDVGLRVFFNKPLQGTPEIVSNSLVGIAFLQIAYVLMIDRHVRATVFMDKLPLRGQAILQALACVFGIILFLLILIPGWDLFVTAVRVKEFEGEGALRVPTSPVRFFIVFGSLLMVAEFIRQLIVSLKIVMQRKER